MPTPAKPSKPRRSPGGVYRREGREGWYADLSTSDGRHRAQRVFMGRSKQAATVRYGKYLEDRKLGRVDREALDSYRASRRHKDLAAASNHPTLADAWSDWEVAKGAKRSFEADQLRWRLLMAHLSAKTQLRKLTGRRIDEALAAVRAERGVKEATVNRYRALIRSVLKLAAERTEVGFDPSTIRTTREVPRDRVLSDVEIGTILDAVESEAAQIEERREKKGQGRSQRSLWLRELALAVRLGLMTSRRRGDLVSLRWRQTDLERGLLHIEMTKAGGGETIPLAPQAAEALRTWREVLAGHGHSVGPEDGVFVTQPAAISKRFTRTAKRLGIVDVRFHDHRRTGATRMFEAGVDPKTAATITGHRDLSTLNRHYNAVNEARRRAAADALGKAFE